MKKKIIGILVCMTLMLPALSVTAIANEPPTAPQINGTTNGKAGETYEYTFLSTDPDGDDISYCIIWGRGCGEIEYTDFYPSGEPGTASHTFGKGTDTISVKAVDIHQAESDWAYLEVNMPMNQQSQNWWFLQFLQNHPRMFPILRQLLGWYVG